MPTDIMLSFEHKAKHLMPWLNLEKDEDGKTYVDRDAAFAFVFYSAGWLAGELG